MTSPARGSAVFLIVQAEADAARAPQPPVIETLESAPLVVNDPAAVARTRGALESVVGTGAVVEPGPITAIEDVGVLADAAGAPCVYRLLGGADSAAFAGATDVEAVRRVVASLPSNQPPPLLQVGRASGWSFPRCRVRVRPCRRQDRYAPLRGRPSAGS